MLKWPRLSLARAGWFDEVRQIVDNSKLITSSVSGKVCLGNSLCVDNKYEGSNNIPKYGTSIQTHIPYTEYCGWIEVGKERRQDMWLPEDAGEQIPVLTNFRMWRVKCSKWRLSGQIHSTVVPQSMWWKHHMTKLSFLYGWHNFWYVFHHLGTHVSI